MQRASTNACVFKKFHRWCPRICAESFEDPWSWLHTPWAPFVISTLELLILMHEHFQGRFKEIRALIAGEGRTNRQPLAFNECLFLPCTVCIENWFCTCNASRQLETLECPQQGCMHKRSTQQQPRHEYNGRQTQEKTKSGHIETKLDCTHRWPTAHIDWPSRDPPEPFWTIWPQDKELHGIIPWAGLRGT